MSSEGFLSFSGRALRPHPKGRARIPFPEHVAPALPPRTAPPQPPRAGSRLFVPAPAEAGDEGGGSGAATFPQIPGKCLSAQTGLIFLPSPPV